MVKSQNAIEHEPMDRYGTQVDALRVSDTEREVELDRLKEAYAEGRIDHAEFDLRMALVMTAKTRGELAALVADLAPRHPSHPTPANATGEDRMLAALAHGSGAVTSVIGPLILMLLSGKRSEYVRRHAVEALNFQLTLLLITIVTFGIGGFLYAITWLVSSVAALVALTGKDFRHPWIIRPIK
jgi:uncharacterized protein